MVTLVAGVALSKLLFAPTHIPQSDVLCGPLCRSDPKEFRPSSDGGFPPQNSITVTPAGDSGHRSAANSDQPPEVPVSE